MTIGLLIAGAAIFLLGMLTGACVLRLRVTKFGARMLVDIGRPRRVYTRLPTPLRPERAHGREIREAR